eukprot:5902949-Pleurochrysis_carterae.AAC.1
MKRMKMMLRRAWRATATPLLRLTRSSPVRALRGLPLPTFGGSTPTSRKIRVPVQMRKAETRAAMKLKQAQ